MPHLIHLNKVVCCLLMIGSCIVYAQEHNPAQFISSATAENGFYQYGKAGPDLRHPHSAIMVGKPKRQQYDFFSAQEERALWGYLEQQKAALFKISEPPITFTRKVKKATFNPVRVLLKDEQICVPTLEKSEVSDWKNFLVCAAKKVQP